MARIMSTARCPRCHDPVTVPSHVSLEALVECPWCQERYAFAEVASQLPPTLKVVGSAEPVLAPDSSAEPDLQLFPAEPVRPIVVTERARYERPASRARRPVRSKSLVGEIVKIVAGGLVGLSVGQLILWWMPGRWATSQRDPLKIAEPVGRWLPFLVPDSLRAGVLSGYRATSPAESSAVVGPAKPSPKARSPRSEAARLESPPSGNTRPATEPSGQDRMRGAVRAAEERPPAASGNEKTQRETPSPETQRQVPDVSFQNSSGSMRWADIGPISDEEFRDLLHAAEFAYQQADPEEKRTVALPLLLQLARDAARLSLSNHASPELLAQLDSWLYTVAPDAETRRQLAQEVSALPSSPHPFPGSLLWGEVVQIAESGAWHECHIKSNGDSMRSLVLIPSYLSSDLEPGEQVLVLGITLLDARKQLDNYSGEASRALVAGWISKLQKMSGTSESSEPSTPLPDKPAHAQQSATERSESPSRQQASSEGVSKGQHF